MSRALPPARSMIDRLPPHSLEAEQGVLGCCLLDAQSVDKLFEMGIEVTWFYDLRHQTLWSAMFDLWQTKNAQDMITIAQALKDRGELDGVGGLAYMSQLMDCIPSAANLTYYADIVREKAMLRKLLVAAIETQQSVFDAEGDPSSVVDAAEVRIFAVRGARTEKTERTAKQMAKSILNRMQERMEGDPDTVPTGFRNIDRFLVGGGMRPCQNIILAARPSVGKSALAAAIAMNVCMAGGSVGVFSLEMSTNEYEDRMATALSSVPVRAIRKDRKLTEEESKRLTVALSKIHGWKMRTDDRLEQTMPRIRSIMRRWKREMGLQLVVIDYLQLIESTKQSGTRETEVAAISRHLKMAAKELEVPVITLCQLNREIDKEKARKPKLTDLRESGSIEQDADMVWALYDTEPEKQDRNEAVIGMAILKQRDGPRDVSARLRFEKNYCRFSDFNETPA